VDTCLNAVVRAIHGQGKRRFVVTYPNEDNGLVSTDESVTFSVCRWGGDEEPIQGQVVKLFGVTKCERGWRAKQACPLS